METQQTTLSDEQVARAAAAGIRFFTLETTLIPGNIRRQLDVLEVVLQGLAQGSIGIASRTETPVELGPEGEDKKPAVDLSDLTGQDNGETAPTD